MRAEIQVDMLGGLRVAVGETQLVQTGGKINKPWQVLCFLVMNRAAPTPPARLISALWPDESLADPGNVLKNTVYALRRAFKNCTGAAAQPVLWQGGGYICNPDVEFLVDAERFEALCSEAGAATETAERSRLLLDACGLYAGGLLPALCEEGWVNPRAVFLRSLYTESVNELGRLLFEAGRYSELLAAGTAASRIEPLEETFTLHVFRALDRLQMYRVILPLYQKTAGAFAEAQGRSLPEEVRRIYAAASEKVNPVEEDILSIKDDLRELRYDNAPPDGPLYCTYDVFKYLYQMVARTAERTGARILIVLVSLQQEDGGPPTQEALDFGMQLLKDGLLGGLLRKSDTVARYSASQYILMLNSDQANGAQPVVDRVRKSSEQALAQRGLRALFSTTALDPSEG